MYIENEFEGWFSLYVSPLMIVGGFAMVAFGIVKKNRLKAARLMLRADSKEYV